ncbi:hypothetical protein R6Q57_022231 [Mikania cordata]
MNPRPNNPNPEFNPVSYDPESLRNLLVKYKKTRTSNTFNNKTQTFNHNQISNPVLLPTPKANQPDNEVVPETQDTQKRNKKGKKNKQSAGTEPSSGPMATKQLTPDKETTLGKCYMDESENKTKVIRKNVKIFGKKSPLLGTI